MSTNPSIPDALDDPLYRIQMQGLVDMTAAIEGRPTSPVVFSTDPGSVLNAATKATRFLVVDGMDGPHQDGNFAGDGAYPPFVVFDVDAQQNIAGPFDDRKSADEHRLAIIRGEPALLNGIAMSAYWDTHPMIQPDHPTTNETSSVKVFTGYVLYESTRIQVDFEVPKDATEKDREAAFLAALAQQAEVNYLEVGESESSMVVGQGGAAQISDSQRRALIAYGDARASGTPEDVARTFVDALHTHPKDGAAADQSTASGHVTQLTHQRDVLMKAIADLAVKVGIVRPDASLSGPDVLMLCEEMSEVFPQLQDKADLYGFLRDSYADQSPDDEAEFAALARTSGAEFDSMLLGTMVDARVKNLDKLALGAGVGYTLSQVGAAAIFAAGGDIEDVDWPAVQEATIQEAMVKNGQDRGAVFNTLCEHSPAAISTERRVALAHRIAEVAAGLELSKTQLAESSPRP